MEPHTLWMLELAALLGVAKVFEAAFIRLNQPKVMAYLVLGLILSVIHYEFTPVGESLAILGIIMFLFHVGLEGSMHGFFRTFKEAGLIAVGGVVTPIALSLALTALPMFELSEALVVGVALTATSISVSVRTLSELGKDKSAEGQAVINAAVVDDVLGIALISSLIELKGHSGTPVTLLAILGGALGLWFLVSIVISETAKPLLKAVSRLRVEAPLVSISIILLLSLAFIASYVRLSAILLAYAAGLGFSTFRYFAKRIDTEITPVIAIFTPLFFIRATSLVPLTSVIRWMSFEGYLTLALILGIALASKLIGCSITAVLLGFPRIKALIIGVSMMARAELLLTAALVAKKLELISDLTYLSLIIVVPVSLLVVPPILKYLYSKLPE